jgi:hypothetical protein
MGLAGETFVAEVERRRLHAAGKIELSRRVEHVALTRGDGLGYDVLSFENSGQERFIEVKTTAYSIETPFYISSTEVEFSMEANQQYRLYRLFDFRRRPRLFQLQGPVANHCRLDPRLFVARFQ